MASINDAFSKIITTNKTHCNHRFVNNKCIKCGQKDKKIVEDQIKKNVNICTHEFTKHTYPSYCKKCGEPADMLNNNIPSQQIHQKKYCKHQFSLDFYPAKCIKCGQVEVSDYINKINTRNKCFHNGPILESIPPKCGLCGITLNYEHQMNRSIQSRCLHNGPILKTNPPKCVLCYEILDYNKNIGGYDNISNVPKNLWK